jgi:hypothetical protein
VVVTFKCGPGANDRLHKGSCDIVANIATNQINAPATPVWDVRSVLGYQGDEQGSVVFELATTHRVPRG